MPYRFALPLALLLVPAPLVAQTVQPLPARSDADQLADQMRRIGANPQDLDALLTAGELSIRLDDLPAASSFFARVEKVDARNGRAKAGEGAVLVRSERPGESLRYFTQAEQLGLPPVRFAADRGLAYDLLGEQARAQRDYRLALASRDDDETRRRYALSLAIGGHQREALAELAPLVAKDDRAAWRDRAFVLAMGGDAAEAGRIAQTMMPPGSAQGLRTFFTELPRLPATDRAFAVHFGEVHPSATRLADARLAPALPPLAPEPVQVAAAIPATLTPERRHGRHDRTPAVVTLAAAPPPPAVTPNPGADQAPAYRAPPAVPVVAGADRPLTPGEQASLAAAGLHDGGRRSSGRTVVAPTAPVAGPPLTPAEQASLAAATLPQHGRHGRSMPPAATAVASRGGQPVPAVAVPAADRPLTAAEQASLAAATLPQRGARTPTALAATATAPQPAPAPTSLAAAPELPPVTTPTPAPRVEIATTTAADRPLTAGEQASLSAAAASDAAPRTTGTEIAAATPAPSIEPAAEPPIASAPEPTPAAAPAPEPIAPAPRLPRRSHAQADAILGRIVAGLSIPAAELGVGQATPAATRTGRHAAQRQLATDSADTPPNDQPARTGRHGAAHQVAAETSEAATPADKPARGGRYGAHQLVASVDTPDTPADQPATRPGRHGSHQAAADASDDQPPTPAERRAAARQALADRKAAADKKAALEAAVAEKAAKKAERAQPARYWVQVGGGADPKGLGKAWNQIKAKAPDAFAGHQAYTTPLRFTNRVLTGPFKTHEEAQAYVNKLIKAGVNAFSFQSSAGQKVSRLDSE